MGSVASSEFQVVRVARWNELWIIHASAHSMRKARKRRATHKHATNLEPLSCILTGPDILSQASVPATSWNTEIKHVRELSHTDFCWFSEFEVRIPRTKNIQKTPHHLFDVSDLQITSPRSYLLTVQPTVGDDFGATAGTIGPTLAPLMHNRQFSQKFLGWAADWPQCPREEIQGLVHNSTPWWNALWVEFQHHFWDHVKYGVYSRNPASHQLHLTQRLVATSIAPPREGRLRPTKRALLSLQFGWKPLALVAGGY